MAIEFRKTGLPDLPRVRDAYDFAYKEGLTKIHSPIRQAEESRADVALKTALIITEAMGKNPDYDIIGGHLAGCALPLQRGFYGSPLRRSMDDLTRAGLAYGVAAEASRVQEFRFDNSDYPKLTHAISSGAPEVVKVTALAGAIYALESLEARYGKMSKGAKEKVTGPVAAEMKPVADIIRAHLDAHAFHKNIQFLQSVKTPKIAERYKRAISRAENLILVLKPEAPPDPAVRAKLVKQWEQAVAQQNKVLQESYRDGPYTKYYGALVTKMKLMGQKP